MMEAVISVTELTEAVAAVTKVANSVTATIYLLEATLVKTKSRTSCHQTGRSFLKIEKAVKAVNKLTEAVTVVIKWPKVLLLSFQTPAYLPFSLFVTYPFFLKYSPAAWSLLKYWTVLC